MKKFILILSIISVLLSISIISVKSEVFSFDKIKNLNKGHSIEKKVNKKEVFGDLHVVSVYEGDYYNKKDFSKHTTGNVKVEVEIKHKPITLLLTSHESVNWEISAISGANIKKIYYISYYDSIVNVKDSKVSIEQLKDIEEFEDSNSDEIKNYFQKEPQTFQYDYQKGYFFIDGKQGRYYKEPIIHKSTEEGVKLISELDRNINVDLDNVGYANCGAMTNYYANKYYNKGKYYFEAQLIAPENEKQPLWMSNIGIIAPYNEQYYSCAFASSGDNGECYSYGLPYDFPVTNEDIIGYAFDLDNDYIYVSINGDWIIGNPKEKTSIYKLRKDNREYTAAVAASDGISWKVNFGSKKFANKIPSGFKPFDTYSAKQNKVN